MNSPMTLDDVLASRCPHRFRAPPGLASVAVSGRASPPIQAKRCDVARIGSEAATRHVCLAHHVIVIWADG